MSMLSQRWTAVTEPQFPRERSALTYLHERLPGQDPCRALRRVAMTL